MAVTGWPVATMRRGRVVMRDGKVQAEPGDGRFLARGPVRLIRPRGVLPDGFDASAIPHMVVKEAGFYPQIAQIMQI